MTLLQELRGSGSLKSLTDFRTGSLYDPVSGQLCATMAGIPTWARTARGFGIASRGTAAVTGVTQANAVSLQLNTCTLFAVAQHESVDPITYHTIFGKQNAYLMMLAPTTQQFVVLDPTAGSYRASGIFPTRNTPHMYVATIQNTAPSGTNMYVDGIFGAAGQVSVLNHASYWVYGCYTAAANNNLQGSVLLAGVVNRILSPTEVSRLYDEWLNDDFILDVQHRRGIQYFIPAKSDADYAREGIVLATDFVRQPGGLVRDLTGNYPGTVTGVPVPGSDGEGQRFATADEVNWGDVTQLNSAAAFSIELLLEFPSGLINGATILNKTIDASNVLSLTGPTGGPVNPAPISFFNYVGGAGRLITTTQPLRGGTTQHVVAVFNGAGATNPDKAQIYVDADPIICNFLSNFPAASANLAARNLLRAAGAGLVCTERLQNLYNRALTAGDVRKLYLQSGAQKCDWQATGEDQPVSLVASYGTANPNALGGGWQIISGTWKISEDTTGKKWIECVTAGVLVIPQTNAFGTWQVSIVKTSDATVLAFFLGTQPVAWNNASQTGYMLYVSTFEAVYMIHVSGGASDVVYTQSADSYIALNKLYTYTFNRRASDGRFTSYLQGGIYAVPTLISTVGGSGSNPGPATANFDNIKWVSVNLAAGDKLLIHDPAKPGSHPRHFQGQLDPTKNEIPQI